jgi:hypothetical protein
MITGRVCVLGRHDDQGFFRLFLGQRRHFVQFFPHEDLEIPLGHDTAPAHHAEYFANPRQIPQYQQGLENQYDGWGFRGDGQEQQGLFE